MDIRYSCNQKDFKRYTTEEMRDEMLITGLYKADEVVAVYSHVDRMVTLGCMPVHETVSIDKGIDVWANFGTHYFLERREIGIFNIGKDSTGIVVADGVKYELGYRTACISPRVPRKLRLLPQTPSIRQSSIWSPLRHIALTRPASSRWLMQITVLWAASRPAISAPSISSSTPTCSRPAS